MTRVTLLWYVDYIPFCDRFIFYELEWDLKGRPRPNSIDLHNRAEYKGTKEHW